MGGCRCTFRDCPNNTKNSPNTHFFRFPINDAERCKKWALYAERVDFLKLPASQLRNKGVCGYHFTDESYMNIKKESLVRKAVPTLHRLSNGELRELEVDQSRLAELVYPMSKPDTIDLPAEEAEPRAFSYENRSPKMVPDTKGTVDLNGQSPLQKRTEPPAMKKEIIFKKSGPVVQIRNAISGPGASGGLKRVYDSRELVIKRANLSAKASSDRQSLESKGNNVTNPLKITYQKPAMEIEGSFADDSDHGDNYSECLKDSIENEQDKPEDKETELNAYKKLYLDTVNEHAKQIDKLKKMFAESLQRSEAKMKQSTNPTSSNDVSSMRVEKGPAMTKIQLFNGIRKYLNPTMVALLRMEMFGSSDRENKPDEKQLSKELFVQSAEVYEYMREEWRFRLPTKTQVETWLKETDDEDMYEPY